MRVPVRLIAALCALSLSAAPAVAEESAVDLLFEEPHLETLEAGTVLSYDFSHQASEAALGEDYEDRIEVTLEPGEEEGRFDTTVMLFSGERRLPAGPFRGMSGNPIIMLFLEHDVLEMNRHLEGNAFYIRNRIKDALGTAVAEPVTIRHQDEEVAAWKVVLRPFANEQDTPRLNRFVDKQYEFVLAEAVPGWVYEIRAVAPSENGAPLTADLLRFEGAQARGDE